MAKQKNVRVQDLGGLLNQLFPQSLAEDWDNVGLQVGDPAAQVERVLVCLDAEEQVIERAEQLGAQLVISHHPLIYRPLKRITPTDEAGKTVFRALRQGIAVISAHTNLDRAKDGLNDWLAAKIGLQQCQPFEQQVAGLMKLVVYVPLGHEQAVMDALFAAGAGEIGAYDRCSFRGAGIGSFRPGAETDPFIGEAGGFEQTEELRIETIFPEALTAKVVAKMLKVHPYEEAAFDLYPLANRRIDVGLGRVGTLAQPLSCAEFAVLVKQALAVDHLRVAGPQHKQIKKVAVCGGSGASLLTDALRQGVDCFLTGDIKYHEAQRARAEGLTLMDAGHFGTEILMVKALTEKLKRVAEERYWALEFIEMSGEEDPFCWM